MEKNYKIFVFGMPFHGHINPTLGVIKSLVEKGHRVVVYNTKEFKNKIESVGAELRSPKIELSQSDRQVSKNGIALAQLLLKYTEEFLPEFIEEVKKEKPDLILHDQLALWGKVLSQNQHIPAISYYTMYVLNPQVVMSFPKIGLEQFQLLLTNTNQFIQINKKYNQLKKTYSFTSENIFDIFSNEEDLNIVFTSKLSQPKGEVFKDNYSFVGPSIEMREESLEFLPHLDSQKKLIYISMGTIYNDNLDFYKVCVEAFKGSNYEVIISVGDFVNVSAFKTLPSNITIKNYVPQLEVLKKADLFITHAGMNSVNESVMMEVPMILIPVIQEQQMNASRIAQLGGGMYLEQKSITSSLLLKSAEKVLNDPSFHECIVSLKETFIKAGGYRKAVDDILAYLKKKAS